jgi:hypothetical protein
MTLRAKVGLKEKLWLHFKEVDIMSIILPIAMLFFFFMSLLFDLRHIPYFIPYNSSSDKLSIYFIDLSRDYLEKISLGLMTSFFSAWLVKYVIDKNALRKDKKRKLIRAYRGVYSQIAIVVEAATHQFLLGGMNPDNNPYYEQLRSIHYSHGMIDPVFFWTNTTT